MVQFTTWEEANNQTGPERAYLKFVKVKGEYRLAFEHENRGCAHSDMVDEHEYSDIEGAGTMVIRGGSCKVELCFSDSLRLKGVRHYTITQEMYDELDHYLRLSYDPLL